jgi:hypothetical protein
MWFLWLFGKTVEGKLGHHWMAATYFVCLLLADIAQQMLGQSYSISLGASGAVSGIIALYWFLFPRYELTFFYFFIRFVGIKELSVHWAVAWWIGWDMLSVAMGFQTGVAHWAHLGGFAAGLACAYTLRKLYLVKLDGDDMLSLWQMHRARRRAHLERTEHPPVDATKPAGFLPPQPPAFVPREVPPTPPPLELDDD